MKLTEAKLKQLIKEVIEEGDGAKAVTDLPKEVYVCIAPGRDETIDIFFSNMEGERITSATSTTLPKGVVTIQHSFWGEDAPCNNGMLVAWSLVDKGWGPLLYDVAIEVATSLTDGGLAADRTTVSSKAYKVWNYYLKNRSLPDCSDPATAEYHKRRGIKCPGGSAEITYVQLDDSPGDFTKDRAQDDCLQGSSLHHARKQNIEWSDTAVSKMYKKSPTTLKSLKDKLIVKIKGLSF
tara:strand:+ start:195 stop:905 length:711 start_codon:yes stop_codon:yes gene_type:complete